MSTMRMRGTKKFAIMSAISLLFAGVSLAVTAPTASAETCTHPSWSNQGSYDDQLAYMFYEAKKAPMHTGPEGSCALVETITSHKRMLVLDCTYENSAGNYWSHVYDTYNGDQGWIYGGYLDHLNSYDC
jgi:hypothetical protein